MSLGALESIAQSLSTIAGQLGTLESLMQSGSASASADDAPQASATTTAASSDEDKPAASKKRASKKTAAKKTAAKKSKAPDLDDITVFKKQLFDVAESSGVEDVMPKLKAFIKANEYGSSDEIETGDRAEFLESVKAHFADLSGAQEGAGSELDDL